MKSKVFKLKNMLKFMFFFLLLLSYSCENEVNTESEQSTKNLMKLNSVNAKEIIKDQFDFDVSDFYEWGNYYIVEGDIAISKSLFDNKNTSFKHGIIHSGIPTFENQVIGIQVAANINQFTIADNINAIVSVMNSIYSSIEFNTTGNDIIISDANLSGACGMGPLPLNGDLDPNLFIDENYLFNSLGWRNGTHEKQMTFLLAHELGHKIGLRHTNIWQLEDSYCAAHPAECNMPEAHYGVAIPGTHSDAGSVMNSSTCGYKWSGNYTTGDRAAITNAFPGITVSMNGPSFVNCYDVGTWTPVVANAHGSYTCSWNWKIYRNGVLESNNNYSGPDLVIRFVYPCTAEITLTVNDGVHSRSAFKTVTTNCPSY